MRNPSLRRRTAWTLAILTLAVLLHERYGTANASINAAGALRLQSPSSATQTSAAGCAATARALIRYDSGYTLCYATQAAMFAQLAAQEQPGMVRAVLVQTEDGRWLDGRLLDNYHDQLATIARSIH